MEDEDLHKNIEGLDEFPTTISSISYMQGKLWNKTSNMHLGEKTTLLVELTNSTLYVVDFFAKLEPPMARDRPF